MNDSSEIVKKEASKSVQDSHVVRIYTNAMAEAASQGLSGIAQIEQTFRILKGRRDEPGMSADLNLAAAEWFAYARYCVATGFVSQTQMSVLSYGYHAKKVYDKNFGDPNTEAVTGNPVSEPNSDVANWGMAGAIQGAIDHTEYNVQENPPFWRSIDSIMGQSHGGYRSIGTEETTVIT